MSGDLIKLANEIFSELLNVGSFLQIGDIQIGRTMSIKNVNGKVHHWSSPEILNVLSQVLIGAYISGFMGFLGIESAKKIIDLVKNLKKREVPNDTLADFKELEKIIESSLYDIINSEIDFLEADTKGCQEIESELRNGGLPENRAKLLTQKIALHIHEYLSLNLRFQASTQTNKTKIFISHAWEDKHLVKLLEADLKAAGADVWVDHIGIRAGDNLPERISEALEWCDTLLLIWSGAASKSHWVKEEWTVAFSTERRIIPCLLDKTKLPVILSNKAYVDFCDFDKGLIQLQSALKLVPQS